MAIMLAAEAAAVLVVAAVLGQAVAVLVELLI